MIRLYVVGLTCDTIRYRMTFSLSVIKYLFGDMYVGEALFPCYYKTTNFEEQILLGSNP